MANPRDRNETLRRIAKSEEEIRRLKLRGLDAAPSGGAWCLIEDNRNWVDGAAGFSAQVADMTPWDQSGGFTLVDPQTLALPDGLYTIEWTFTFEFFFVNPYASGFFGEGWALWQAAPIPITGCVTSFGGDQMLAPVRFTDYGGGDASVRPLSGAVFKWSGIVKAGGGDGSNLALGIIQFTDFFRSALDWTTAFTEVGQSATTGSGRHNIWIASIGA